jgi:CcmD family protein
MGHIHTLAVVLVIWIGLFLYLWRVERKVSELEKREE